jgi:hypothetical protein
MIGTVDALIHTYTRRYVARDVEGVTELCIVPFLAIRKGAAIHLPDRDAVREHFAGAIESYRTAGYAAFSAAASDTRELGENAAFTTVHWHAIDANGRVVRDTLTTYHVLATPGGWRFLSYTNHF